MAMRVGVVCLLTMLVAGCATAAKGKMDSIQTQLTCGMSPTQVEAIVGERLHKLEARDPRKTHFYRSGMADLWLRFDDAQLRSSQVVVVQGLIGIKEEPVVNHCK